MSSPAQRPSLSPAPARAGTHDTATAYYRSAQRDYALRSRSVSGLVLSGQLDVPAPPQRLLADWQRETAVQLDLQPGEVQALPLARARMRWPDYRLCLQAVSDWTSKHGLQQVLADSAQALMACRGAHYHHDGAQYGASAFCNLFVSEDQGLDVHFAFSGQRIPLRRGTVMVFDTGQPHGLVARGRQDFDAADFGDAQQHCQVFLTWELPIEAPPVAHTLGIAFDTDPAAALLLQEEQVRVNGGPVRVCPQTGRWLAVD